jgi:hypothetical protein
MKTTNQALRRVEEINEQIEDFYEHQKNNNWKNYNFQYMFKWMYPYINFNLSIYGQVSQELFLIANLKLKFPSLNYAAIDKGHDERLVVDENGNEVHQILHPLPIYKKYEIMLYHELNKKYENDPEILNLKEILSDISKIIENKGIGFSQENKIALIDRALKAYHPGGPIWIRMPKKNKGSQKK